MRRQCVNHFLECVVSSAGFICPRHAIVVPSASGFHPFRDAHTHTGVSDGLGCLVVCSIPPLPRRCCFLFCCCCCVVFSFVLYMYTFFLVVRYQEEIREHYQHLFWSLPFARMVSSRLCSRLDLFVMLTLFRFRLIFCLFVFASTCWLVRGIFLAYFFLFYHLFLFGCCPPLVTMRP